MYDFTCTKNLSFNAIFPILDGEGHQASNTLIIYTYKLVMIVVDAQQQTSCDQYLHMCVFLRLCALQSIRCSCVISTMIVEARENTFIARKFFRTSRQITVFIHHI